MKVRPYYKIELAQAYAPDVGPRTALNRLASWIRTNKKLTEALRETDYRASQHMFASLWMTNSFYAQFFFNFSEKLYNFWP